MGKKDRVKGNFKSSSSRQINIYLFIMINNLKLKIVYPKLMYYLYNFEIR